ncbi:conserved protein of unknown function [Candidatus Nitrospira inopinata]|jgi:hypothetical protein|uniref:DUF1360 domain-containing protein n=1 Tax=Candidatus Nitrospira inopinata TaxID=1715989 RepID=A0A0S4KTU3_9BACT|nr:conserved protein of unknown function [Candidatus Nitrospira inopinata]
MDLDRCNIFWAFNSEMRFYWLIIGVLAVWRVTHLFSAEDGPWQLLARLRRWAGEGLLAELLDCFYCLSLWIAMPIAWLIGEEWKEQVLLWLSFSGGAILLERVTGRSHIAPALYHEEPTYKEHRGEDHGMLRKE